MFRYTIKQKTMLFAGVGLLFAIITITSIGALVYTPSPQTIDFTRSLQPPTWHHPGGFNDLGQDVLARVLVGGRVSLIVGFGSMLLAVCIGTTIGLVAGFVGGTTDIILMHMTNIFLALPILPLLLLIMYLFQEDATQLFGQHYGIFMVIVIVVGGIMWMNIARLVRSLVLRMRQADYVLAAKVAGASPYYIMWHHLLPGVLGHVVVSATMTVSWAIVTESTLSFLGFGFPPDVPSWGRMLYEARNYLELAPHMALLPASAIVLTVTSVHLIGDSIQYGI